MQSHCGVGRKAVEVTSARTSQHRASAADTRGRHSRLPAKGPPRLNAVGFRCEAAGQSTVIVLSRAGVERLLDLDELIDALASAHADLSAGRASMPARIAARVDERDAILGAMPAYLPSAGALMAKLVTLFRTTIARSCRPTRPSSSRSIPTAVSRTLFSMALESRRRGPVRRRHSRHDFSHAQMRGSSRCSARAFRRVAMPERSQRCAD